MRRIILSLVMVAGFAFLGTMEMEAQKTEATTTEVADQAVRPGFTDANKDGVCDHYDGKRAGKGLGPGNGKGEGRANGKGLGRGKGLRDGSGQGLRDGSGNNQRLRDGSGPGCAQTPAK